MDNRPTSARELLNFFKEKLSFHREIEEIEAISMVACMESMGMTKTDVIADKPFFLTTEKWIDLQEKGQRLSQGEPVQYVFNNSWFYGREFYTAAGVLIPRQETEELVDLIVKENRSEGGKIVDIGTGSGCISVSLDLELSGFTVQAIDVSDQALEIARKNNNKLGSKVEFTKLNILTEDLAGTFDVIVSNPPYVPGRERKDMLTTVSEYEPGLALFVPDDDELLFYRRIMGLSKAHLADSGKIYFEIHESFGEKLVELAVEMGYSNSTLIKDINSKDRILRILNI